MTPPGLPSQEYFKDLKIHIANKIRQRCNDFIRQFGNDGFSPGIIERIQAFERQLTEEITLDIEVEAVSLHGSKRLTTTTRPQGTWDPGLQYERAADGPAGHVLRADELGANLIQNLQRFIESDERSPIVSLSFPYDWILLANAIQTADGASSLAVQHAEMSREGVSRLTLHPSRALKHPDLTENIPRPSNAESSLDHLLRIVTSNPIPYYVGPLPASSLDTLFPSGELAAQLHTDDYAQVPGITTLWGHLGEKGSGTPFHCEDGRARSYNLNVYGYKLWILVSQDCTDKFESLVKRLWPSDGMCDQFVRHASLFITPERLRAENIIFELICAGPGTMVMTKPRQYHAVMNLTTSFAIATNFILPGEEAIPPDLPVCPEDGLYNLRNSRITKVAIAAKPTNKRAASTNAHETRSRKNPAMLQSSLRRFGTHELALDAQDVDGGVTMAEEPQLALAETHAKLRARQAKPGSTDTESSSLPQRKLPKLVANPSDDIKQLAECVRSQAAITRFISIIRQWRTVGMSVKLEISSVTSQCDRLNRAAGWVQLASHFADRSSLYKLLSTLVKARFALEVDSKAEGLGRARVDTREMEEILAERGVKSTPQSRKRLSNDLAEARRLVSICGEYNGLLCFIPYENLREYCALTRGNIAAFHNALNHPVTTVLCKVGQRFQDSLWTGDTLPIHWFETRSQWELDALSVDALLPLLEAPREIEENIYSIPDWPRPDYWPEAWPWPVSVDYLPEDSPCDHCSGQTCECVMSCFPRPPDIQVFRGKGFGLVARELYESGARIGQLVGQIVSPGKYTDGWAFAFRRTDIPYEPDVGQIYCRDEGNCLRFINHSCGDSANAGVRIERISGRARTVIFALRQIDPGEEITANWGIHYMDGKACLCSQCSL